MVEQKPTRQVEASHLLMSDPKQKMIKKKKTTAEVKCRLKYVGQHLFWVVCGNLNCTRSRPAV